MDKNYFKMHIEEDLYLVYPEIRMAKEGFALIDSDREHLGEFLDFIVNEKESINFENYLKMQLNQIAKNRGAFYFVAIEDKLIGCVELFEINYESNQAELGYWLHSDYTNKRIMSSVVKKICFFAFNNLQLNKLTIVSDTENSASSKVALNNGFKLVGVSKEDTVVHGEYRDMNYYQLFKRDFLKDKK